MKNIGILVATVMVMIAVLSSCLKEDDFITDSSAKLRFSVDTLHFDTVFTQLGSATRHFKIYNDHDQPIRISDVRFEGGAGTFFRMNIDGIHGQTITDAEIWPNDSIYAFAEVTIDPSQPEEASPYVIEDKMIFTTNGNEQVVHLDAWGQNAVYLPSRFNKGVPSVYSCDNGEWVWDDPRPYVLYGEVFIDSCLLRIPAGTQVHVHGGVAKNDLFGIFNDGILYMLENGSISVEGTPDEPVVFQGDRLEEGFEEQAGQWFGIILGKGSKNNSLEYATVKNSSFGLYVDSMAQVDIKNSQFYNTTGAGIIGFHSTITAENCLIYNNNTTSVQCVFGGDYQFDHCTIASYGVSAEALTLGNFNCYGENCAELIPYRINARFRNCIITGSRNDQIVLADVTERLNPTMFNVRFDNCLTRVDDLLRQQNDLYADFMETMCLNCEDLIGNESLFVDRNNDDYHLDTLSVAENKGMVIPGLEIDLENNNRDNMPDIGCYEYLD